MIIHPSKKLIGMKSSLLKGKRIILGITGSVAAIKAPDIARELMRHGAEVFTVMSEMAKKIIHPYTMEWATGNPVVTELTGKIEHVSLVGEEEHISDVYLIAPATANTISKIANGIDDTPVTSVATVALGLKIPIVVVPAMHDAMYNNPFVKESIEKLKRLGIYFVDPLIEEGKAKIAPLEEIVLEVMRAACDKKDLINCNVLVTGGPTREFLDPIRFISNPSSGKMGLAIAESAYIRGANVYLVMGPNNLYIPRQINCVSVTSAQEMFDTVFKILNRSKADIFISAAAVADYTPEKRETAKIRSDKEKLQVILKKTQKIVKEVKRKYSDILVVGFKAESNMTDEALIRIAKEKINEYNIDAVVANDISRQASGFGKDYNEVIVVTKSGYYEKIGPKIKIEIADRIFDILKREMASKDES